MDEEEIVFEDSEPIEYVPDYQSINTKSDKNLAEKIDSVKQKKAFADSVRDAVSNKKSNSSDNKMNQAQELQKSKIENARKNSNLNSNKKGNNQMVNKLASGALTKAGIPKPASDALVNSKAGQKAIEAAKTKVPALNAIDKLSKFVNKDEEKIETVEGNGLISNPKVKYALIVGGGAFALLVFIVFFLIAPVAYMRTRILGNADAVSDQDAGEKLDKASSKTNEVGYIGTDNLVIYSNLNNKFSSNKLYVMNTKKYIKRKYQESDLEKLEEFFGDSAFDVDEDDMKVVYNFYFKLYDIYTRYNERLGVSLDMPLLMSTLYLESDDVIEVFKSNTEDGIIFKDKYDHNASSVKDYSKVMELDYDYDWSDYKISNKSSFHDIEVLAQHMVSQNEQGEYQIDNAKYKEFLNEFIEKKYYLNKNKSYAMSNYKKNSKVESNGSSNSANGEVSGEWQKWTQCGMPYSKTKLGNSNETVCSVGCLVTSISIQIARSGTTLKVDKFDPGVFANNMTFASDGSLTSSDYSSIAPNFKFVTKIDVKGLSNNQIIEKINSYTGGNYYFTIYGVPTTSGTQHHVAYLSAENGVIKVQDPTSLSNTTLDSALKQVKQLRVYVKED